MDPLPAVSVLMPCYNAAGTLPETLASLDRQSLSDFEVVAIDDGSQDQTYEVLRQKAFRDSRYRVLTRPHAGIISALNDGLSHCCSALVARMDADDIAFPHRLEHQVTFLNDHPELAVAGCLVEGFPHGQVREGFRIYIDWLNSLTTDRDIRREMFVESPLAHPSVVFRREWVEKVGGYQERGWAEDYDLWLRLYLAGARFGKISEILLKWREYPQRLTRSDSRYSVENFLRAKAYYLARGPLANRDAVIIWGAGMMGRRLCKQLMLNDCPVVGFIDVDPKKIGKTRRGLPVRGTEEIPAWLKRYSCPALLSAVGARGARRLIRNQLNTLGLREGMDWWSAA
jgi:glycosyltransferase involved in cell wall biosynthesis